MMRNVAFLDDPALSHLGWIAGAACKSVANTACSLLAMMTAAVAHARGHRQLARLDMRMLQDIGLEPFDVYYGWRGPGR